jgi:hypothetical protein
MKQVLSTVALLGAALSSWATGTGPALADRDQAESPAVAAVAVTVELDRDAANVGPGEKVRFESTVRNTGDQPLSALVAHLSIFASDPDVYVDPEDWSPRRTQFINELAAGEETQLQWEVQAVTAGPLVLYVGVSQPGTDEVAASGLLRMTVGGQREVNAANALPLVLGMPALVLVLLGLAGIRQRRRR